MNDSPNPNYQKQLDRILAGIVKQYALVPGRKQTLLLHACCAPCSSYVLEYLASYFEITVYYYNPNIYPPEEYFRRLGELQNFLPVFPPAVQNNVKLVLAQYNPNEYDAAVQIEKTPSLADEQERGERCHRCYLLRMKKAYEYAAANNFDWFTTTLSISPFKDAEKINAIGNGLQAEKGPKFLTSDFKKKNGFLRSLELSSAFGLYRQQYCGCRYSLKNTHHT
ncbi:MAG: epoxyqueuosine reductase QueH [Treponema sp.]|nr:epoxyqueuosine reductase QueH [Treponema sp.]